MTNSAARARLATLASRRFKTVRRCCKAISSEQRPEVGTLITLGKTPSRVVRHIENGFAVEFTRMQHPDFLEENVTGP